MDDKRQFYIPLTERPVLTSFFHKNAGEHLLSGYLLSNRGARGAQKRHVETREWYYRFTCSMVAMLRNRDTLPSTNIDDFKLI